LSWNARVLQKLRIRHIGNRAKANLGPAVDLNHHMTGCITVLPRHHADNQRVTMIRIWSRKIDRLPSSVSQSAINILLGLLFPIHAGLKARVFNHALAFFE